MRPERHQYNFKPRYNNEKDILFIQELEKLRKKLGLKKSEFVRMALTNLVNEVLIPNGQRRSLLQ
jgi:hypothetical protein